MQPALRMRKVLQLLKKAYPDAECSLRYQNPFQLVVATILSAQCTDERVNQVTPVLFKRFPDAPQMAKAKVSQIEQIIRSTGFYRNKAKNIHSAAKKVISEHKGEVPSSLSELVQLPGVGRKTANVVLGEAFQKSEGIVVDTHVRRLALRLGFTRNQDPVKIEKDLMEIVPRGDWALYSHLMISHGRSICRARKPSCHECGMKSLCPQKGLKTSAH